MDWANERYARLFVRDTPEWLILPWQAKALWPLLVRKFDRSGVLATRLGLRGVAVLVGLPMDVVEPGVAALIEDGCLQLHELGYLAPNFLEAQETPQSDAIRKRESRERRRAHSNAELPVTDVVGHTECHAVSRGVQVGHAESREVTPIPVQTDPVLVLVPESTSRPKGGPRKKPNQPIPEDWSPRTHERDKALTLHLDCDREATRFRNHHLAKGTLNADWNAAFRTWLDKAVEFAAARGTTTAQPKKIIIASQSTDPDLSNAGITLSKT